MNIDKKTFTCNCGKSYNYSSGLSKHKHKCKLLNKSSEMENKLDVENNSNRAILYEILQTNKEILQAIKTNQLNGFFN